MWYSNQNSKLIVRQDLPADPLPGFAVLLRNLHPHRVLQVLIVMIVAHIGAGPVYGELAYKSDFETGAIKSASSIHDGWLRQTMDRSCSQDPAIGLGCVAGVDYSYSDNVVTKDGTVQPRAGNYFVRLEVRDGDNPLAQEFNARSNLLQPGNTTETHIPYNTTGWLQWSVYIPDQANEPTFSEIQTQVNPYPGVKGHTLIFSREHGTPSASTPNSMRMGGWYWTKDSFEKHQIESAKGGFGHLNPIPIYYDEWVDFRLEIKSHELNGRCVLWQRFPERDNVWTQVLDYSGPLGYPSASYGARISQSSYGGGNWPRILYFDEIRITNERIGSTEDVDIPTDDSPPKPPVLLEE